MLVGRQAVIGVGALGASKVADGDKNDDAVTSFWGGCGVDSAWYIDIEARLVGKRVFCKDGVEGFLVLFSEEDVVCRQLGNLAVKTPVERD